MKAIVRGPGRARLTPVQAMSALSDPAGHRATEIPAALQQRGEARLAPLEDSARPGALAGAAPTTELLEADRESAASAASRLGLQSLEARQLWARHDQQTASAWRQWHGLDPDLMPRVDRPETRRGRLPSGLPGCSVVATGVSAAMPADRLQSRRSAPRQLIQYWGISTAKTARTLRRCSAWLATGSRRTASRIDGDGDWRYALSLKLARWAQLFSSWSGLD